MRRFTSTAPARGVQAPNRAISNSCRNMSYIELIVDVVLKFKIRL